MPKLRKRRIDENRQIIEQAALGLFTRQGSNGTNIRDIADAAAVSTGAIYTYYPSKEALFTSLVHSRETAMSELRARMFRDLEEPFSPKGLMQLANSIRTIVYDNSDYWRLMYIDVVEFDNRHFAESFHDLPEQFRQRLGDALAPVQKDKRWCGEDPGFAYASIYLHLFTYFLVEKLFRGNQHMGVPDDQAMQRTVNLLCDGLWRGEPARDPSVGLKKERIEKKKSSKSAAKKTATGKSLERKRARRR
jgi:AcrR family transcriptional regulator